jgi:hypothetical protein
VGVSVAVKVAVGVALGKGVIVGVSVKRIIGVRDGSTARRVTGGGVLVGATVGVACGTTRLQAVTQIVTIPHKMNRSRMNAPYV